MSIPKFFHTLQTFPQAHDLDSHDDSASTQEALLVVSERVQGGLPTEGQGHAAVIGKGFC